MAGPLANAPGGQAVLSRLNITTTTVVKATPGSVLQVNVVTTGSTAGAIYDSTGTVNQTSQIAAIGNAVGSQDFSFPCFSGIVVVPGTSQVVTVVYQ